MELELPHGVPDLITTHKTCSILFVTLYDSKSSSLTPWASHPDHFQLFSVAMRKSGSCLGTRLMLGKSLKTTDSWCYTPCVLCLVSILRSSHVQVWYHWQVMTLWTAYSIHEWVHRNFCNTLTAQAAFLSSAKWTNQKVERWWLFCNTLLLYYVQHFTLSLSLEYW